MPSTFRIKHERIAQCIDGAPMETFIEHLLALESILHVPAATMGDALVPAEANFQLPNVFLRTKANPKVERILEQRTPAVDMTAHINKVCDLLDELEWESVGRAEADKDLEALIRLRTGN